MRPLGGGVWVTFLELLRAATGPAGAVAVLLVGAWLFWAALEKAKLQLARRYEAEIQGLREEIQQLNSKLDSVNQKLDLEHAERLADAKEFAKDLLATYQSVTKLTKELRALVDRRLSDRPPPATQTSGSRTTTTTSAPRG